MDDVHELALCVEHRDVSRAPVSLLESPTRGFGSADVVLLDRHGVRGPSLAHAIERRAQVADPGGRRVVGVVGEHLEQSAADDLVALGHRGGEIRLVYGRDGEVGRQDEIRAGRRLEQETIVRGGDRAAGAAHETAAAWANGPTVCSRKCPRRSRAVFKTTRSASGSMGEPSAITRKPPTRITTCKIMTRA